MLPKNLHYYPLLPLLNFQCGITISSQTLATLTTNGEEFNQITIRWISKFTQIVKVAMPWVVNFYALTRYFIPVTIENRTCDISSATIGTLFLCCVRVWTKIQERCCLFCFGTSVLCMQRKSRNFCINNNTHDARWEKPRKTGESS